MNYLFVKYLSLLTHFKLMQISKYIIFGLLNNLFGYIIYLLLSIAYFPPKFAMTIDYIFAVVIGFLGNSKWIFKINSNVNKAFLKFGIIHILGYSANYFILSFFVDKLGYPHQFVQGVAIFVIAIFLFIFFKLFVFEGNKNV